MFNFVFYPWSTLWCTFCCRRRLWWGIVSWTPRQRHRCSSRFGDLAGFHYLLSCQFSLAWGTSNKGFEGNLVLSRVVLRLCASNLSFHNIHHILSLNSINQPIVTDTSIAFTKVSETAFSLTAGYFLAYWWYDKRITLKEGDKKRHSCF